MLQLIIIHGPLQKEPNGKFLLQAELKEEDRMGEEGCHSPSPQECRWVPGGREFPGDILKERGGKH